MTVKETVSSNDNTVVFDKATTFLQTFNQRLINVILRKGDWNELISNLGNFEHDRAILTDQDRDNTKTI